MTACSISVWSISLEMYCTQYTAKSISRKSLDKFSNVRLGWHEDFDGTLCKRFPKTLGFRVKFYHFSKWFKGKAPGYSACRISPLDSHFTKAFTLQSKLVYTLRDSIRSIFLYFSVDSRKWICPKYACTMCTLYKLYVRVHFMFHLIYW